MKKDFDIVRKNEYDKKSFRVANVFSQFDLQEENLGERFQGSFDIPDEWNIGVIVGKSGTGKSTIARELFGNTICDFKYSAKSVIDDFDKSLSFQDIVSALNSVGFSSPPSWIKPYCVLSNGEKMRVDLARAILTDKDIVSFDEFTSVVDREIAKMGSFAIQKAVRKNKKKFIAISCHYDILEWLQPDWVFFTDDMSFKMTRGLLQRPEIKIDIRKTRGYWRYFRKYHYLSHNFSKTAKEFTAFYNGKPIGFVAINNYPNPNYKHMRMIHRVVVLPDYQGIGIGQRLISFACHYAKEYGKADYVSIITSLKVFAYSISRNPAFALIHQGRISRQSMKTCENSSSHNRNSWTFKYIGE